MINWNRTGKVISSVIVLFALIALFLLNTTDTDWEKYGFSTTDKQALNTQVPSIPAGKLPATSTYAPLPTVAAIEASVPLARELAKYIDSCRFSRIQDSVSDRPIGKDPFLTLGTTSDCASLLETYGTKLDVALSRLKTSPDPIERGYYYDANYDQIAEAAAPLRFLQSENSPTRQAYEKLTDSHFEDVMRDLDKCDEDSIIRAHLSLKLTSPKYDNPDMRFFMSYLLVAHDYTSTVFVDAMRAAAEAVAPEKVDLIKVAVFKGTETCGIGPLGKQMASFAAQR